MEGRERFEERKVEDEETKVERCWFEIKIVE